MFFRAKPQPCTLSSPLLLGLTRFQNYRALSYSHHSSALSAYSAAFQAFYPSANHWLPSTVFRKNGYQSLAKLTPQTLYQSNPVFANVACIEINEMDTESPKVLTASAVYMGDGLVLSCAHIFLTAAKPYLPTQIQFKTVDASGVVYRQSVEKYFLHPQVQGVDSHDLAVLVLNHPLHYLPGIKPDFSPLPSVLENCFTAGVKHRDSNTASPFVKTALRARFCINEGDTMTSYLRRAEQEQILPHLQEKSVALEKEAIDESVLPGHSGGMLLYDQRFVGITIGGKYRVGVFNYIRSYLSGAPAKTQENIATNTFASLAHNKDWLVGVIEANKKVSGLERFFRQALEDQRALCSLDGAKRHPGSGKLG